MAKGSGSNKRKASGNLNKEINDNDNFKRGKKFKLNEAENYEESDKESDKEGYDGTGGNSEDESGIEEGIEDMDEGIEYMEGMEYMEGIENMDEGIENMDEGMEYTDEGVEEYDTEELKHDKKKMFDSDSEDDILEGSDEEGIEMDGGDEEGVEMDDFRDHEEGEEEDDLPADDVLDNINSLDLKEVQSQIQDLLFTLANYKEKSKDNKNIKPRSEYLELLKKYCSVYYGYNEDLCNVFFDLFNPKDCWEFFEANEKERPLVIRTNSLKTRLKNLSQVLTSRGVHLSPVGDWTNLGLVIYQSSVPIGATPEYLAGHYMLQSAASFLPVIALNPQPNEKILDMCSAPGGKTSHIAQLMKNTGTLIANDISKERLVATVANLTRLGVTNCIVSSHNGLDYPQLMRGFDRVLLDAPCTGLGIISRDHSVKTSRTYRDLIKNSTLQKKLILSAIDSVDCKGSGGGIIVYSTCSISVEENERVISYALKKRDVKIVDTGLTFGTPGFTNYKEFQFHPSMKLTRRFYPHTHNLDGFFVAKLKKMSNKITQSEIKQQQRRMKLKKKQKEENIIKANKKRNNNKNRSRDPSHIKPNKKRGKSVDSKSNASHTTDSNGKTNQPNNQSNKDS